MYQLKVTLRGSRPAIWRRVTVSSEVTLYELHRILQVVMGWMDSHPHEFERGRTLYGQSDPEFGVRRISERKIRLQDVLRKPRDRMRYQYDFGDSWEHDVLLEAVLPAGTEAQPPRVLDGKGACPPEDVGGIWGYAEFLEAIRDPQHPEHQSMLDWCGGAFDPDAFDAAEINLVLARRGRRKARR